MWAAVMYPLWVFITLKILHFDTETAARLCAALSLVIFYVYWSNTCTVTHQKTEREGKE